ncbi:Flp family type IVb pilin [Streptomyces sp. NPDC006692]|uniref:Flp family type IVb pilin n=1 Tax=Streptomyces sp. NPDC006692 TaxID=3364758 RepID=UPI0036C69043
MSSISNGGAVPIPAGSWRVRMPRPVEYVRLLVVVLFVLTVLSALGVLLAAPFDGELLGALAYAVAPGVAGFVLLRWLHSGGPRVRWALMGVQVSPLLQALGAFAHGQSKGLTQLAMPLAIVVLLCRRSSREWFLTPNRPAPDRRPFSLARMIKWRHSEEGQTAVEYAGLITLVVGIVLALVLSGLGGQISGGIQSAICKVTGSACPPPRAAADASNKSGSSAGASSGTTGGASAGGPSTGGSTGATAGSGAGGSTANGGSTGANGSGGANGSTGANGSGGANGSTGANGSAGGAANGGAAANGGSSGGASANGGANGGAAANGGSNGAASANGGSSGASSGAAGASGADASGASGGSGDDGGDSGDGGDTSGGGGDSGGNGGSSGDNGKNNGGGGDTKKDDGCFSGFGAFFSCAGDQVVGAGKGLVVDGVWGDVKDGWNAVTHPIDTVKGTVTGLWNYGSDIVSNEWDSAWDKVKKGDVLGLVEQDLSFGPRMVWKLGGDFVVTKDVRDAWNRGDYGEAFGLTLWNGGSYFIPGVGEGKLAEILVKLEKINKINKVVRFIEKANEAFERVRKAIQKGDIREAEKAADDAQKAADDAADKARKSGCTVASAPLRVPYGGGSDGWQPRSGGTVVTASYRPITTASFGVTPGVVQIKDQHCDAEDGKDAHDAQQKALDSRVEVLKQAIQDAKKDGVHVQPDLLDNLLKRVKDNPDPLKKEIGPKAAADAVKDVTDLLEQKNIDKLSREQLASKALNSKDADALAQNLAESNITKNIAKDEAADGTTVYSAVGDNNKGRSKLPDGKGGEFDVSGIPDVDVVYRGKDGKVNVVEVKNRGNATTQASFPDQVQRLGDWAKKDPARAARYEVATTDGWEKVFDQFQYKKQSKTDKAAGLPKERPAGTPASEMAKNGVSLRVGGKDLSPDQLRKMDAAWNAKSDAEKYEALHSGKMKDPKTAMEYLGVS